MYYTIFAKREENFLAKIDVAPLAGARIEIIPLSQVIVLNLSLPSRERGLKLKKHLNLSEKWGRSPRGSAD